MRALIAIALFALAACHTDVIELAPIDAAPAADAPGADAAPPDAVPPPACDPIAPASCGTLCDQSAAADPTVGACVPACTRGFLCTHDQACSLTGPSGCASPTPTCCQSADRLVTLCADHAPDGTWTCN